MRLRFAYIGNPHGWWNSRNRSGAHRAAWNWCVSTTGSLPHATAHRCTCSTGKNTFLNFVLARLVLADQVVFTCSKHHLYIFYHGKVYFRPAETSLMDLPIHPKGRLWPTWTLVDSDSSEKKPPFGFTNIWPIQTSSPNPSRWEYLKNCYGAYVLGMPLWNVRNIIKIPLFLPNFLNFMYCTNHFTLLPSIS